MIINEVPVKSSIASAMGAKISVTGPGRCIYLVIGNGASLAIMIKNAGGEVVLRINGGKMLVTLPFTGYLSLRGNRLISHIGPITVEMKRLAKIAGMLAKANSP